MVKYIVRSIHDLLKTHFQLPDGLASKEVTLLDPAGGTLTFPAEAIKLAIKEHKEIWRWWKIKIYKNSYTAKFLCIRTDDGTICNRPFKDEFFFNELGYTLQKLKDLNYI